MNPNEIDCYAKTASINSSVKKIFKKIGGFKL